MGNDNFALQSTEETRKGGMAGVNAMRMIELIAGRIKYRPTNSSSLSMDEWWQIQNDAVLAMHRAAGIQDEFMSGFLAAIAEYVMCTQEGDVPYLDKWKPEAIMTEEEKVLSRAKFERDVNEVVSG